MDTITDFGPQRPPHRKATLRVLFLVALLGICATLPSTAFADDPPASVRDREKVVDLPRVQKVLEESTAFLRVKISKSRLKECFAAVIKIGEVEDPDLYQMSTALEDLEGEIDTFLEDWDLVTEPLHKGRDAIGETIADIRTYLVQGPSKERKKKLLSRLDSYESRLEELALQISREKDPQQIRRLKGQFAMLLKLRNQLAQLLPGAGGEQLQASRLAIYGPLIQALSNLDGQIVEAGYHAESTKLQLEGARDSVVFHRAVVAGLIEVREIAEVLGAWAEGEAGQGPTADFSELLQQISGFSTAMERATGRLAGKVFDQSEGLADSTRKNVDFSDLDLDAELERYTEKARAAVESDSK